MTTIHTRERHPQKDASPKRYMGGNKTRVSRFGYILEYCPTHPRTQSNGYMPQHRLLMEVHLGRFLGDDEVVHHKNGDRQDNRIENLEVMSRRAHAGMHGKSRPSKWNDPAIVEMVRAVANSPETPWASLPLAGGTILGIRKRHGIVAMPRVQFPAAHALTEESVRAALRGRTKREAAGLLGVTVMTLYNKFPHLLDMTTTPRVLDTHMDEVLGMVSDGARYRDIAMRFGVQRGAISKAVRRWKERGAIPDEFASPRFRGGGRKRTRKHTAPRTADTPPPHDADPQEC